MADIRTNFAGLMLQSPVIAGSCGLTADAGKLREIEENGAGAVILKSVFEEQMRMDVREMTGNSDSPEEEDYLRNYVRANTLQHYIGLVKAAKAQVSIPVIASINCIADGEWVSFAKELEQAGADALELNIFALPLDEFKESGETENVYYSIVKHLRSQVRLPLIVKISHYFTNLVTFVSKLKAYGADAVTLFNRFYEPDIDIERLSVGVASVFSNPSDLRATLRWTGILAGKDPQLQISASTGVHSGEAVVKMLLAGATTVRENLAEASGYGVYLVDSFAQDGDPDGVFTYFSTGEWHAYEETGRVFPPLYYEGKDINRADEHYIYKLEKEAVAVISKAGGGTLCESFSGCVPMILTESAARHEEMNKMKWIRQGFGISFEEWSQGGFSRKPLEECYQRLHTRIGQAQKVLFQEIRKWACN